jgi:hypothetical protein
MKSYFMRSESVCDEVGQLTHTVIEDQDGNIVLDNLSGDWCNSKPNAYSCYKHPISIQDALELGAKL